jgi:hypothetical protein
MQTADYSKTCSMLSVLKKLKKTEVVGLRKEVNRGRWDIHLHTRLPYRIQIPLASNIFWQHNRRR